MKHRISQFWVWLVALTLGALVPVVAQVSSEGPPPDALKTLSLEELGNIKVVTQSKEPTSIANTPAAIYVLTGDEIRRSGVTSVPDALRLVPGVNVARVNGARNWAVGIRGLGDQFSKYVQVLIDGRSVYSPLFGGVYWNINNVMLEDIDRIEVIRGPGGTIWGANAVNGIINIITKSAADTQGLLLSAGGGNVDQGTADVRYGGTRNGMSFRTYVLGFVRSAEYHANGQPDYDNSKLLQFGTRADWKRNADEVTVQGDGYFGRMGDAQTVSTYVPPTVAVSYKPTDTVGGNLLGRWRRSMKDDSDIYVQAFWTYDYRTGSNFGETRNTFDMDFLHRTSSTTHQQFTYGAGLRLSPSTTHVTDETDTFVPAQKTDAVYSGFLQEELRLVPGKLALIAGTKLEHNNYTGFDYQPSGRLLWTPTSRATLWASVSRAVRTPDRVDDDIHVDVLALTSPVIYGEVIGNQNLRAERLVAYEGGTRFLLTPKIYAQLTAFHNVYGDLIAQGAPTVLAGAPPFPPGSFVIQFQYQNGVRGTTDGFEFAPDWQPAAWWQIKAAYSYLHFNLENKPGFSSTTTLTALHGSSPNSQAVIRSLVNLPNKFEFDQTVRFVGSLPAQNVRRYVTADVRLGRHVTRGLDFSMVGENLFQPHHGEFGIDPGPNVQIKRSVYAKLVWTR